MQTGMSTLFLDQALRLAVRIIAFEEGLRLKPYLCPAGYWTIGYGHVIVPQKAGPTTPAITREQAEALLMSDCKRFFLAAIKYCPVLLDEPPARLAAVTSFAFNVGDAALKASTLRRKINAREWEDAEYQLNRWTRAGARKLPVLVARRKREAEYLMLRKGYPYPLRATVGKAA